MTYERPNTVAGLTAKHAELTALREEYRAAIKKLTVDIDHLDAAIRLFDKNADLARVNGYAIKHKARKGSVQRFVLKCLREASGPLTSRDITEMWAADRGLQADEATLTTLRKRIGACITTLLHKGLVRDCGWTEDHGESGPYKRWEFKRG